MKLSTIAFALIAIVLVGCDDFMPASPNSLTWHRSLSEAKKQAQAENKMILVNFTGSDWCGWCMRLRSEVFVRRGFANYATNKLVLLEIDFPRNKEQSAEEKRANQALAERFKVEGFPTVVLLDKNGQELGRTGYQEGGPRAFVAELQSLAPETPGSPAVVEIDDEEEVEIQGVDGLRLKGISGANDNRLALINNTSLRKGESATIKAADRRVVVRCLAIRDHSVVVTIDGDDANPAELRLSGRL